MTVFGVSGRTSPHARKRVVMESYRVSKNNVELKRKTKSAAENAKMYLQRLWRAQLVQIARVR